MTNGRTTILGTWSACVVALAAAAGSACAMKARPRDMPPAPGEVTAARAAVDQAFDQARTDPASMTRAGKKAVKAFREALEQWAKGAAGDAVRITIRGWAFQVGSIETSIVQLPKRPDDTQIGPIRAEWARLRAELP